MRKAVSVVVIVTCGILAAEANDSITGDLTRMHSDYERKRNGLTTEYSGKLKDLAESYITDLEKARDSARKARDGRAVALIGAEIDRIERERRLFEKATAETLLVLEKVSASSGSKAVTAARPSAGDRNRLRDKVPADEAKEASPSTAESSGESKGSRVDHLAVGAEITASSTHFGELGEGDVKALVDGDTFTRWSSEYSAPQEIVIDLGESARLKALRLHWEKASATKYSVLLSNDGEQWRSVYLYVNETTEPASRVDKVDIGGLRARKIKLDLRKRVNDEWGFSLYEIEVIPAGR
ncbi:MAG: discoidin domain-containing protein [Kiritimatiellia bacterium]